MKNPLPGLDVLRKLLDCPLNESRRRRLLSRATLMHHPSWDMMTHHMKGARVVGLVMSGTARRFQLNSRRSERILSKYIGPKSIYGLEHVFSPGALGFDAFCYEAITPVKALEWSPGDFDALLESDRVLSRFIMHYLSREVALATMQGILRTRLRSEAFLARVILQIHSILLAGGTPEPLLHGVSRKDLCDHTGMSRQAVSLVLGKFRRLGLVKSGRGPIHLLSVKGLTRLAMGIPDGEPVPDTPPEPYVCLVPAWSDKIRR